MARTDSRDDYDLYVTGRDPENRSQIGRVRIRVGDTVSLVDWETAPCLTHGELGAFDENGVSYPCVVEHDGELRLYYTGWVRTYATGFQNHLGMAVSTGGGDFVRHSRAPIMARTDPEPFSVGSSFVMRDGGLWHLWYTCFTQWERADDGIRHRYLIRYAESDNGVHWRRDYRDCIGFDNDGEFAICRPAVFLCDGRYHMWFCTRGEDYELGYAVSDDGRDWTRVDERLTFQGPREDWESRSRCYPSLLHHGPHLFMFYSGNDYGRGGLGVARLRLPQS